MREAVDIPIKRRQMSVLFISAVACRGIVVTQIHTTNCICIQTNWYNKDVFKHLDPVGLSWKGAKRASIIANTLSILEVLYKNITIQLFRPRTKITLQTHNSRRNERQPLTHQFIINRSTCNWYSWIPNKNLSRTFSTSLLCWSGKSSMM